MNTTDYTYNEKLVPAGAYFTMLGCITLGVYSFYLINKKSKLLLENNLSENQLRKKFYYKFQDFFDQLEDCECDPNDYDNKYIKIETGLNDSVIMGYNSQKECFDCWYDNNKVDFIELDTIAQLYCVHFNCKKLCVNYRDEIRLAKSKSLNSLDNSSKETKLDNKIFAEFKDYNKKKINKKNKNIVPEKAIILENVEN